MKHTKRTPSTARRFTTTELGHGKTITAIRNEFKVLEYEYALNGDVLGSADSFSQAEVLIDEAFYEALRNDLLSVIDGGLAAGMVVA